MTQSRPDVALARVQNVFAVVQEHPGELALPNVQHLILPTGDVVANQTTPVTDSREKADTLDVRNVFQSVASPASVEMSMYFRTAGLSNVPQGDALLTALQGMRMKPAEGALDLDFDSTAVTPSALQVRVDKGVFPERGVLQVNSECIQYRSVTVTNGVAVFGDLTTAYKGTAQAAHFAGEAVKLSSVWYAQNTHRPECTLWVQTDSILQCVEGCRVAEASIALATSDAVDVRFSISGRRLFNGGQSKLAQAAAVADTSLVVENARVFFAGQVIRNPQHDTSYVVERVDELTNTLELKAPLAEPWAVGDVVTWWLPDASPIGREVENRDTTMRIAGERGAMLPGSIRLSTPVSFTEEVGDRFPGQGIDGTRACSVDYNVLMRKDAALRLREGFEGREVRYDAEFGAQDGYRLAVVAPRMKLATASVGFQSPTVTLSTSGRLLGSGKGENSVQIILE